MMITTEFNLEPPIKLLVDDTEQDNVHKLFFLAAVSIAISLKRIADALGAKKR